MHDINSTAVLKFIINYNDFLSIPHAVYSSTARVWTSE